MEHLTLSDGAKLIVSEEVCTERGVIWSLLIHVQSLPVLVRQIAMRSHLISLLEQHGDRFVTNWEVMLALLLYFQVH